MGRGQGIDSGREVAARRSGQTKVGAVALTTVKGLDVRVDLHRAIDDGMRDAWDVDLLEAHGPEGPAGYLKAAYIPGDVMESRYPSAFHWAVLESGSYLSLQSLLSKIEADVIGDRRTLLELLSKTDTWQPAFVANPAERRAGLSTEELEAEWRGREASIAATNLEAYKRFRRFHLDRPFIEYIRVYAGPEAFERPYRDGRRLEVGDIAVADYRRKGVGRALYEVAALWMSQRGLELHASGIQSSAAGAVWACFEQEGVTKKVAGQDDGDQRQILDGKQLLQSRPELSGVARQINEIVAAAA